MANVNFRKGLRAGLPATYSEGTFYVTTDERAIYLDVSDSARIRLGDFQEFATIDALTANTNPSTTALYYVTDINCLAKWNGSEYVQINKDTGMTSVEVVGDGNAVTAAVYSADGRKLTLTKGATYMTAADVDSKIVAANGELIHNGTTYNTVAEFVNAKTAGIATDAALGDLQNRVAEAEADIDAIQAATGENGTLTVAVSEAQKTADEAAQAAETAQATAEAAQALAETKTTMAEVEAKGYATADEAKGYADAKDEAISAAQAAADAAQGDVDALEQVVGTPAEGKTIVQMIADAQAAATYDDTQVKADIATNAGDIATIKGDYLKNADKEELAASIQAEADRADAAEKVNAAAIAAVKEDLDAFLKDADLTENAVDTLKEIQTYIDTDGAAADEMVKNISDNTAAIEAEVERAGNVESALSGRIDALEAIDHDHSNKAVLDGITAEKVAAWDGAQAAAEATASAALSAAKTELEGKITSAANAASAAQTKADEAYELAATKTTMSDVEAKGYATETKAGELASAAETAAKDHADGLNTAMNTRVAALEAIDHDAYKGYADQAEADAVTSANAYADSLATNYDAAGSAATAEQNAKDYADSLVMTWGSF